VHSFYKWLLENYADKVQEESATKLADIVAQGEPPFDDDGIPNF
jgi:hypothetical protein